MNLIVEMNKVLQDFIPGHVGRYTDEFYPTAMGDNLHKLGYKNILIESGTYNNDTERQVTREANYLAILRAFEYILEGVSTNRVEDYKKIPNNGKRLLDLIIRNVGIELNNVKVTVDLGIMYNESPDKEYMTMVKNSRIENIGDLSQFIGLKEIDAENFIFTESERNNPILNQKATFEILEKFSIKNGDIIL